MNPILKLIGEAEDFSEYEDILKLDAEQEKTLFDRELSMSPAEAYTAAKRLGKGRVSDELERTIAKNAAYSFYYALYALGSPFPLGEDTISKDAGWSFSYAKYILKARFPLGEPAIRKSQYWKLYKDHFNIR